MRHIILLSTLLLFSSYAWAETNKAKRESSLSFYDDYLMLRYFPSRSSFIKNDPVIELTGKARTSVLKRDGSIFRTNKDIQNFFNEIKTISDMGINSNQRHFHVAIKSIEVKFKGETIKLEYTGKTDTEKYKHYEARWLDLYQRVYQYLIDDLALDK